MPLKKILIIIIIILGLVIAGLFVYNFFFKETALTPGAATGSGQNNKSQTLSPGQSLTASPIKPISQEPVLNPVIDGKKVKYYLAGNGNVYQSDFDGANLNRISSNVLTGLLKVLWSSQRDKVIAIFEDQGLIKKYLYDYKTNISTRLNADIRWISWSPQEDKITYQYYNPQNEDNSISVADPTATQWTNVFKTRMKDLIVEWPSQGQISIRTKPSGLAQSIVYTINLADGQFKKVLDQTYGLTALWSPLGNKLLFSETDEQGKNLKLKIADLTKSTVQELELITLPEKCVWSQDNRTIFCAVPKTVSNNAVLPDDYYKGLISFADDFWRINLDTGQAVQIFKAENEQTLSYDAKELLLSPKEDYLLLVNKKDGLLYSLAL